MNKFLVAVATFSLTLTTVIIILPLPTFSTSNPQVLSVTKVNISQYLNDSGIPQTKPEVSFGKLIEATPAGKPKNRSTIDQFNNNETINLSISSPSATIKSNVTIVLLGDSMIDTLGKDLPDLKHELQIRYPKTKFTLYNYGAGATNIESGLRRLTETTEYLGQTRPPILSLNPDILVIESFAYNHWDNTQSDLDRQWLTMAKIVDTVKNNPPAGGPKTKIIIAASIAPYCPTYTDGSTNLPPDRKYIECQTVIAYLNNTLNFAKSQKLPLADVFHASLNGGEGNPKYINSTDHIHPSNTGKQLFSEKVAEAVGKIIQ